MRVMAESAKYLLGAAILVASLLAADRLVVNSAAQEREPRILTGADVGFRLEGTDPATGRPRGTWVVRVDGRWTEVASTPGIRPATK